MKGVKTPTDFIHWMWKFELFKNELSLCDIENIANGNGYTFKKPAIIMALKRAEFITKTGKLSNDVPTYKQSYPPVLEGEEDTPNYVKVFESLDLHYKVKDVCENLFKDGHYAEAISNSFIKLIDEVKEKSGIMNKEGVDLMHYVFNEKDPVLKFNYLLTRSEIDEQTGLRFIFAGAVAGIRNPKAHKVIKQKDPWRTLEYLCVASLLMKRLDESRKA